MSKRMFCSMIAVALFATGCQDDGLVEPVEGGSTFAANDRREIDLSAAPAIQRFVQDLSAIDPTPCGDFEVIVSGTQTVTIKDFGDRLFIDLVRHAQHTNSVTGKSAKERVALTIAVDFVTGRVTWSGNVGNVTLPGEGIVLHRSGRLIFEGGEIVFAAGPHEVLLMGNPGTLCEELA